MPFLGINSGSLGFLTNHEVKDFKNILNELLLGKLKVHKRSMLEITIKSGTKNNQ